MAEEESLQKEVEFFDAFYSPYSQRIEINPAVFERTYANPRSSWDLLQRASMCMGNLKGKRLLDMGSGMGEEAVYFAMLGAHVTAVEISPVGIEITRKRAAHNGVADRVHALLGRADATGLAAQSFDIVHGLGVLHHIGLEQGIKEAARLLKPGGKAVFVEHMGSSPFIERLKPILYGKRGKERYSETEKPLNWKDIEFCIDRFSVKAIYPYHVIVRLRGKWPWFGNETLFKLDHNMLKVFPFLRHFAGGSLIYFEV